MRGFYDDCKLNFCMACMQNSHEYIGLWAARFLMNEIFYCLSIIKLYLFSYHLR